MGRRWSEPSPSLRNLGIERLRMSLIASLVRPALTRQPGFEAGPSDLRVVTAKRREVGLKAGLTEPSEHLIELFTPQEAGEEEGHLSEFDRSSHDAAKGGRNRGVGQLIAGNLNSPADEFV